MEQLLCAARREIRAKPHWFKKIGDVKIRKKWEGELDDAVKAFEEEGECPKTDMAVLQARLYKVLMAEAELIKAGTPGTKVDTPAGLVPVRDDLFEPAEAKALNEQLEPFRATKDWHPGSDEQVLDLIHPSLYCRKLAVTPKEDRDTPQYLRGRGTSEYMWMPTDFAVGADGAVTQLSYINNVDGATHPALEATIATALAKFLTMFRETRDAANDETPALPAVTPDMFTAEQRAAVAAAQDAFDEKVLESHFGADDDFSAMWQTEKDEYYGPVDVLAKGLVPGSVEYKAVLVDVLGHWKAKVKPAMKSLKKALQEEKGEEPGSDEEDSEEDEGSDNDEGPDASSCIDADTDTTFTLEAAFQAAFKGDVDFFKRIPRTRLHELVQQHHPERGTTLLYTAARFGQSDIVKHFFKTGVVGLRNVDVRTITPGNRSTALHGASYGGHEEIVKLLIRRGADTSLANDHGDTPVDDAQSPAVEVKPKAKKATLAALKSTTYDDHGYGALADALLTAATVDGVCNPARLARLLGANEVLCDYANECVGFEDAMCERVQSERMEAARAKLPMTKRFQCIVKAADIVLTPEKSVYPGGTWHLEGMAHENIIATGIYYYEQRNVTPSHLEFRRFLDSCDIGYPQGAHDHIPLQYGVTNGSESYEYLGEVATPEGRCITFPNDVQHRATPFQLVDPEVPGVRKMLVFFLIDPRRPVESTASVPPQQQWMPRTEAIANRAALMAARQSYVQKMNEQYEERISLCEH